MYMKCYQTKASPIVLLLGRNLLILLTYLCHQVTEYTRSRFTILLATGQSYMRNKSISIMATTQEINLDKLSRDLYIEVLEPMILC